MDKIICLLPVIPIRSSAGHRSEMTSQLLFGETARVSVTEGTWIQVSCDYDGYEGWIHRSQVHFLADQEAEMIGGSEPELLTDLIYDTGSGLLVRGSVFYPGVDQTIGGADVSPRGQCRTFKDSADRESMISWAADYLGSPYLWGGKSPLGIDCSGFTQVIARLSGISLKRDAREQVLQGEPVHLVTDAEPGDLAFFDDEEGRIVHTGIILPEEKIIHASGRVRIDTLDHHGIYDQSTKKYTHTLRTLRKIIL